MRPLTIITWTVLGVDAAVLALIGIFGVVAKDPVERATMFGLALLGGVPLAVVGVVFYVAARRHSRVGVSICLALGAAPLILLLWIVAEQNFL